MKTSNWWRAYDPFIIIFKPIFQKNSEKSLDFVKKNKIQALYQIRC